MRISSNSTFLGVALLGLTSLALAQSSAPSINRWTSSGTLSIPRSEACSVSLANGRVLLAGGTGSSGPLYTADIYDPVMGLFLPASPLTQARQRAACVTLRDGRVLIAGGNDGWQTLDTVEIYDPVADAWTPAASLTQPRSGLTATLLPQGIVLLAGGDNAGMPIAYVETYDPKTNRMEPARGMLGVARTQMAVAALLDGSVLMIGGHDGTTVRDNVDVFNPISNSVSAAGGLHTARAGLAATRLQDGTVLVTGGSDESGSPLVSAELYHPDSGTFTPAGNMAEPRSGHAALLLRHNGQVLIVGGTGKSSTELYTPWAHRFTPAAGLAAPRSSAALDASQRGSLLIAGGLGAAGPLASSDLYGFATIRTLPDSSAIVVIGEGWRPGERVRLAVSARGMQDAEFESAATADAKGYFSASLTKNGKIDPGQRAYLLATGSQSQAEAVVAGRTSSIEIGGVSVSSPAKFGTQVGFTLLVFNLDDDKSFPPAESSVTVTLDGSEIGAIPVRGVCDSRCYGPASVAFGSGPFPNLAVGSHNITFTYHEDSGGMADSQVATSFTVTESALHASFTIAPSPASPTAFQPINVTVTGLPAGNSTPSGGVTLLVNGAPSGPAVSLSQGTATFSLTEGIAAGTHSLGIGYAGDENFDSLNTPDLGTVIVTKATPVIVWSNPSAIAYGVALGAAQLNATADTSGGFVYTPTQGAVLDAGSRRISVLFTPDDAVNYTTNAAEVTLVVNQATPVITWANPSAIAYPAELSAGQLNATANIEGSFAYSPSEGALLGAGLHTLTSTFTPADATNYAVTETQVTLQVDKSMPLITWDAPSGIVYGAALSATQLNAASSNAGTFAYTPATGTLLEPGSHTLSATFTPTDTNNNSSVTVEVALVVNRATPTLAWPTPAPITYGATLTSSQLSATTTLDGSFVYEPVAGTLLDAGARTILVTFTPTDTTHYTTAAAEITLVVNKATPAITWATPAAITYGTALDGTQLNATAHRLAFSGLSRVEDMNHNGGSAAVAGTFVYSPGAGAALDAGNHTLAAIFTPLDAANYTTATAEVVLVVDKATPAVSWATPAVILYGEALGPAQLNATSGVAGVFSYSPVAGTLLDVGPHKLVVTFTPSSSNYEINSAGVRLDVNPVSPVVTWVPVGPIIYGTQLGAAQLNASSSVSGTFVYAPPIGTLLDPGEHTLVATFTPAGANYAQTVKSVVFSVTLARSSIAWPTPLPITYGTSLSFVQLNADADAPGGAFTYIPASGTVLNVGVHSLQVIFTPADTRYSSASASVSLTVNRATPAIAWPIPAALVYGTPLGVSQLNAVPSTPGVLTYSHPAGTVLTAGKHTLSATFIPADGVNYEAIAIAVGLTVNKAQPLLSWPTVPPMPAGAALCANQLNATASVPGIFTYQPATGTRLIAGSQTLSVTFTPSDTVNYSSLSLSTTVFVADGLTSLAPVNAAGFQAMSLAPNALFTIFGENLGETALAYGSPLPPSLGGVTMTLTDSKGSQWPLWLIYTAPSQINFQVPEGPALGPAHISFSNARVTSLAIETNIASVAPGLFTADRNGSGVAAGSMLRRTAGGSVTTASLADCSVPGECLAVPIDLGGPSDQVSVVLYGTGLRGAPSREISVTTSGESLAVQSVTPVSGSVGIDQIVISIPRLLAGRGAVVLVATVSGQPSNPVLIALQ